MDQPSPSRDDALVTAARAGDREALNELARRHLPMVYTLGAEALPGDPDVDDVVQDIMVRAIRQLPDLRSTRSFRPWLAAIAVRQVGSHLSRERTIDSRSTLLDEAAGRPDAAAEVEGPSILRAEMAAQRRQVGHATRWIGAEDRVVYSLWWLETAGELTRSEVAVALGANVAHAGVRVQRMREQLELSRRVVAALEAVPGCAALEGVIEDWDGRPDPFWRKRIGRHVTTCAVCASTAQGLLPVERLLAGLALLPVPITLTGARPAGAATRSWMSRALHLPAAHPLATVVSAGVLALGIAVPVAAKPSLVPPARADAGAPHRLSGTGTPQPRPSVPVIRTGPVSLESASIAGKYVSVAGDRGELAVPGDAVGRRRATLRAVAGLADVACFSFRGPDGRYLRHSNFQLRLGTPDGTVLFRRDATFCARDGAFTGSVALESVNFPGFFLRHIGDQMWLDQSDGSTEFRADSSFLVRPPLG